MVVRRDSAELVAEKISANVANASRRKRQNSFALIASLRSKIGSTESRLTFGEFPRRAKLDLQKCKVVFFEERLRRNGREKNIQPFRAL
jgi:hypothetical protein